MPAPLWEDLPEASSYTWIGPNAARPSVSLVTVRAETAANLLPDILVSGLRHDPSPHDDRPKTVTPVVGLQVSILFCRHAIRLKIIVETSEFYSPYTRTR